MKGLYVYDMFGYHSICYSLNDDIHVKIYDNRIEVISPGKLPRYMTVGNIYDERFSRNPNLVRLLQNLPDPVNHDIGEGLDTARNEKGWTC